jgi:F1F0 ATPase subunit 2
MIDTSMGINTLLVTFFLGAGIGLFHFGGLWWTIRRLSHGRNLEYEFILSFFLRNGISISLFYLVSQGHWEKILAALTGFLAVRYVLVRKIGVIPNPPTARTGENINGY